MTWRHYEAAERYDKFDLFRMMNGNNTVTRQFGALMERYDALLTPTLAIRVPEANGPYSLLRDEPLDPWMSRLTDACRYTMPGNETGLPGINIPAGLDQRGPADRRAALRQFRARGPAAAACRAGRARAAGVVRRGAAGARDEGRLTPPHAADACPPLLAHLPAPVGDRRLRQHDALVRGAVRRAVHAGRDRLRPRRRRGLRRAHAADAAAGRLRRRDVRGGGPQARPADRPVRDRHSAPRRSRCSPRSASRSPGTSASRRCSPAPCGPPRCPPAAAWWANASQARWSRARWRSTR